jgi:hypothetical protein
LPLDEYPIYRWLVKARISKFRNDRTIPRFISGPACSLTKRLL